MIEKAYKITSSEGLHARPIAILVAAVTNFESDVKIAYKDKNVNLKSIMGVMTLGVPCGANITISAHGVDEGEVVAKVDEIMKLQGLGNS